MAEYYRNNTEQLSHQSLLTDYGAEEKIADNVLSDQVPDDIYSSRRIIDDADLLSTLERCYRILHDRRGSNSTTSSRTSLTPIKPILDTYGTLAGRYLRRHVFDQIKTRMTSMDHNLYDIIWPSIKHKSLDNVKTRLAMEEDFSGGILCPDYYVLHVFHEFMIPMIKDMHCININSQLPSQPESHFYDFSNDPDKVEELMASLDVDLDPYKKNILNISIECTRNFEISELPVSLNLGTLEDVERVLTTEILNNSITELLNENNQAMEKGVYYTLSEVLEDNSEIRSLLNQAGLLVPLWHLDDVDGLRLHGRHWPYGRGVFVSPHNDVAFWINVLDHLRIIVTTRPDKPGAIGNTYLKMSHIITIFDSKFKFRRDDIFGFLSCRPMCIGNTLRFKSTIRFPYLIKDEDNLKQLCLVRGLTYLNKQKDKDCVIVGNQQSLAVTELQTFQDYTTAIANILQLEKDLALSNSLHIATLFVNIFKRKKAAAAGVL